MIRIALTDDEALIRRGIARLLEDLPGIEIVMEAENGQQLLDQLAAADSLPHIVLLDLNMPVLNGVDTARRLQDQYADIKIIVLSTYFSKAFVLNMVEIGAASYLPKNADPAEMEEAIRVVAERGFYYSPAVMEIIVAGVKQKGKTPLPHPFNQLTVTERESEVLQLICEEYTTAEIAEKLFISPRTVDGHRLNLLEKFDCRNTAGLVVFALQNGLVELPPRPNFR